VKKRAKLPHRKETRTYVSQQDVPRYPIEEALRVPRAIGDNYGYKPATPAQVAHALNMQPASGTFRSLTGAAIAYGLTSGGCNSAQISIEQLGMRIVRPTAEGDDLLAKKEATLRPRVIREFLEKYNGAPVPRTEIAHNVLEQLGVPRGRVKDVLGVILESAGAVGILRSIKEKTYVDLGGAPLQAAPALERPGEEERQTNGAPTPAAALPSAPAPDAARSASRAIEPRLKRVFIAHGHNKDFIEPIKKLLAFGELEAVVAAEKQTASQPVPEKVMDDMRSCGAAIIHVEGERHLVDQDAKPHVVLNENVLVEIGAAMALYGERFILVVKEGITLPSNLQGLFTVRYAGETLGEVTIKLLEAINDMKKRPLPAAN
jgi:predicted nucleotide-binding protein